MTMHEQDNGQGPDGAGWNVDVDAIPSADADTGPATADVSTPSAAAVAVHDSLATPYTIERWRADLRRLAEGASTGFDALDELGLRWVPGKLYAVIARPGHGKTALMLEAACRYLEAHPDETAVFLSWEEPVSELVRRLLHRADAGLTREGQSFRGGAIYASSARAWGRAEDSASTDDLLAALVAERLAAATGPVRSVLERLHIIDGDDIGANVRDVLHGLGVWMRDTGTRPGLVLVDYFQKLRGDRGATSRQIELQGVADALRLFAKGARLAPAAIGAGRFALPTPPSVERPAPEWAVPVVVGAQVTRGGDEAQRAHPDGDRIREADDLLNDAAGVVALSYETTSGSASDDPVRAFRLSVPKNRDGRARPDEVCRYEWRPARVWISERALRDGEGGPVRWTARPDGREVPGNGAGEGEGSPLTLSDVMQPRARGRRS